MGQDDSPPGRSDIVEGMGRRRLLVITALPVALAAGAIVACGAFTSSADPAGADASGDERGDADPLDGPGTPDSASLDASTGDGPSVEPACPPSPAPGCALGTCVQRTLYVPDAPPAFPFAIATDSAYVYWLEQRDPVVSLAYNGNGTARVLRADRTGASDATKVSVLAVGQPSAVALALAPPYLYWATWDGATSTLMRTAAACAPASCSAEVLTTIEPRITKLVGVGSSALVAMLGDGKIARFPVDATGHVGPSSPLATTSTFPGMALTGTHIYAGGLLTSSIARSDIQGLDTVSAWVSLGFDGGDVGLTNLATDCTTLFGTRAPGGTVDRVALSDGAVSPLIVLGRDVFAVAADAKYLYAASLNGGGFVAVDTVSGGLTVIANGASTRSVAVDSKGVYWADHQNSGGGTLRMLVK